MHTEKFWVTDLRLVYAIVQCKYIKKLKLQIQNPMSLKFNTDDMKFLKYFKYKNSLYEFLNNLNQND